MIKMTDIKNVIDTLISMGNEVSEVASTDTFRIYKLIPADDKCCIDWEEFTLIRQIGDIWNISTDVKTMKPIVYFAVNEG